MSDYNYKKNIKKDIKCIMCLEIKRFYENVRFTDFGLCKECTWDYRTSGLDLTANIIIRLISRIEKLEQKETINE